eukprot:CAMPEP_0198474382 /NCGR_PEP_ID=MMETSP1456-20131121/39775_1 /TAXON_ID=1461544 ORGANISM="Unidentified sp., Strain RCC1871" /NCGR_SAMPLE_ID=MMETSP1456 /ASSEMBLY_ACC=CAM_ASM_001119 /LENGTH=86 /DNA_ID=CAMNT_0044201073 /DNA_START=228 /DNA_END=484 /DNA_ORIENTATION=-
MLKDGLAHFVLVLRLRHPNAVCDLDERRLCQPLQREHAPSYLLVRVLDVPDRDGGLSFLVRSVLPVQAHREHAQDAIGGVGCYGHG